MQKGKISEIAYRRSVIKKISEKTEGLNPGVDAAALRLEDVTAVMSSNCILEWFEDCEAYYLQRTMNGIYEKGGIPEYLQLEIVIPTDFEEKRLGKIIANFNTAAKDKKLNICQCRVSVEDMPKPIAHITLIGQTKYNVSSNNIKPEMDVVMAQTIAIGGTAVLARKYIDKLHEKFSKVFVKDCINLKNYINIKEAAFIALENGAAAMHSVSDGGVFSAIWELASSADLGITVSIPDIPVWQETVEVAEVFDINPYMLDGTGALLIVSNNGQRIVDKLNEKGIYASVIGQITDSKDRIAVNGDEVRYLEPPKTDEIYRLLGTVK